MAGLVLRCYYALDVSMKSASKLTNLLFALLVVSKVPFEDLQVRPYIAPSLHRFTARMKSHQILPSTLLCLGDAVRYLLSPQDLMALDTRFLNGCLMLFIFFSGLFSSCLVQLCPAFAR